MKSEPSMKPHHKMLASEANKYSCVKNDLAKLMLNDLSIFTTTVDEDK